MSDSMRFKAGLCEQMGILLYVKSLDAALAPYRTRKHYIILSGPAGRVNDRVAGLYVSQRHRHRKFSCTGYQIAHL